MLASASRSAWRPAPLVGSVAAKVRTAGRMGESFMEAGRTWWGGRYTCNPVPVAGVSAAFVPSARVALASFAFYSTTPAFSHVLQRGCRSTLQDLALPRLRIRL